MLALLGMIGGIWAEKFDHIAAVTNFVITPLSFLSGTFYSIERLPDGWEAIAHFNPFFYLIDGFRYGFIGHADGLPGIGAAVAPKMPPPATLTPPRRYGRVNWLGLWSHYRRGIRRFLDFAWESLGGPCVFTLMFLAVFVVAFGAEREVAAGVT